MNINLKLKERREKINKQKSRDKSKAFKRYQQDLKELDGENPDEAISKRINTYYEIEKKQNEFENKFLGGKQRESQEEDNDEKVNIVGDIKDKDITTNNKGEEGKYKEKVDKGNKNNRDRGELIDRKKGNFNKKKNAYNKNNKQGDNDEYNKRFLNKKRNKEDIDKEKEAKMNKRKKNYRNLSKKTKYGQPIMKYRIQNILHNIKSKISKGII